MAQQRRLVFLAVVLVGGVVFCFQKSSLSPSTAAVFAAALCALFVAGELAVRIVDRYGTRKGQSSRDPAQEERVRHLLDNCSWGSVVLHDIYAGDSTVRHLVFRPEGVVFLVETHAGHGTLAEEGGEPTLNGQPLPEQLMEQTRRKVAWVRNFLSAQLGCEPRLEAGLVFLNTHVAASFRLGEVTMLGLDHLQPWLDTAEPSDEFGKKLWPAMDRLRTELRAAARPQSPPLLALPAGIVLALGLAWFFTAGRKEPEKPTPVQARPAPATIVQTIKKIASPAPAIKQTASRPDWLGQIRLEGVSGAVSKPLAIINRKTVAVGEGTTIKVGGREVYIRCLEISGEAATISVVGVDGNIELRLSDN